ncbi:pleiotropic drug resistance protein 3 isoform X4 [Spinacia oleracea]|uniref:Pleiotropic drug resistance protein 3 isoform X4 n=1 Tax=Spinacia oleracea TaxID=3562 RepID=A0A9R0K4B6_SPIOL|nr:pleiotropic drug resistance protein 3-like isoform X4 [Spinacia oleracea]
MDKVGLQFPAVKVKYKNLFLEAKCKVVDGKPLPTLWNSFKSSVPVFSKLLGSQLQEAKLSIIKDVSGLIKPGRMTLLLGPPGCWKTSLLLALSGNLDRNNEKIVQKLSIPSTGSKDHFRSCFSLSGWEQYKSCLWKQQLSYWRSPSYNLTRLMFAFMSSLIFGLLFWQQGKNIKNCYLSGKIRRNVLFMGLFFCAGHRRASLSSYCSVYLHSHYISDDWVLLISLQSLLVLLCHVLYFDVFQLHGYDARIIDTKYPSGCNYSISYLHIDEFVFWVSDPTTAYSQVVAVVILFMSNFLDSTWSVVFPVW